MSLGRINGTVISFFKAFGGGCLLEIFENAQITLCDNEVKKLTQHDFRL
jgi:hypothetical protein